MLVSHEKSDYIYHKTSDVRGRVVWHMVRDAALILG